MPVDRTGFVLKPVGFFDRNPALDAPEPRSAHCHTSTGHTTSAGESSCH
jgi:primary-amine oxidase